jgi:Tol biopolymer transport system component
MMKGTTPGQTGRQLVMAAATLAASMLTLAVPDAAAETDAVPKGGTVSRASVDSAGAQLAGASLPPVRGGLSGDGTRAVFTNGGEGGGGHLGEAPSDVSNVYVHSFGTGTTLQVSVNSRGEPANDGSVNPSISANGNHVVFDSLATNLGGEDTLGNVDVFVRNLTKSTTTKVSVGRNGNEANGNNFFPVVSGNGNIVAFQSDSSNLVTGDTNGHEDVFVRNVRTSTTTRVSLGLNNKQLKGISLEPSISANGRYVLFAVTPDGQGLANLYVRDRKANKTHLVFDESRHDHAVVGSWQLSGNGRYVAFQTDGALVADDTNFDLDAYRVDVRTGAITLVSLTSDGLPGAGVTGRVAISADGNRIGFSTTKDGYVPDDVGGISDVFVRDIAAATTFKVSVDPVGAQGDDHSGFQGYLGLSRDGAAVSFESGARNLVEGDTNDAPDVFVWRASQPGGTVPE